tara:strand:- start:5455 stop:6273 length:819 start_codon:yes stop_codon:yes gene_type:complete
MKIYNAGCPFSEHTFYDNAWRPPVRMLVSYAHRENILTARHKSNQVYSGMNVKEWILDSGAFTVYAYEEKAKIGKEPKGGLPLYARPIDHDEYIEYAKESAASFVFGLDVIGDADGTRQNLEREWKHGLDSVPTIHYGQQTQDIVDWAKSGPTKRIAIGGIARMRFVKRMEFITEVFRMAWPASIHVLGVVDPRILQAFPFTSADASFGFSAMAFNRWEPYKGMSFTMGELKARHLLWSHMTQREDLERKVTAQWRPLWEKLKREGVDVHNN